MTLSHSTLILVDEPLGHELEAEWLKSTRSWPKGRVEGQLSIEKHKMQQFIIDELIQFVIFKPNCLKKQGEKQSKPLQTAFPP